MITTIATCWEIILKNNKSLCFTDHDVDLNIDGKVYRAKSSFSPSALSVQKTLSADHFELQGIISEQSFTTEQLLQGILDEAQIIYFKVNYLAPRTQYFLRKGVFGEITIEKNTFTVEVRSQLQLLENKLGELYSPFCRANFCDTRCSLKEEDFSHTSHIDIVYTNQEFSCNSLPSIDEIFTNGYIILPEYSAQRYNIKSYQNNVVTLNQTPLFDIKLGDTVVVIEGCNKQYETCCDRFKNIINFRGEPFINDVQNFIF